MVRFRLRYQSTDLEMPIGEFVVGRSSNCHLALDDALVSRRHAVFHVGEDEVAIEDLGSRNGVVVNGSPVEGRQVLSHLDRVIIGSQELLLVSVTEKSGRVRHNRPTLAGMTLEMPPDVEDGPTAFRTGSVLDRLADKALAMGRFEEAERMLKRRLDQILADAEGGNPPRVEKRELALDYALQLAEGTRKPRWVDYVFALHHAQSELVDAERIERLMEVVRTTKYAASSTLREYMDAMRSQQATLRPAERFLLQRLESLLRMVSG